MNTPEAEFLKLVEGLFYNKEAPSEEDLREILWHNLNMPGMGYEILKDDFERIFQLLRRKLSFNSEYEEFQILDGDNDHTGWLIRRKAGITWEYWERYEKYLHHEMNFPSRSVFKLHELTDAILERMGNPASKAPFDVRGMVVGNVQSGKTANFIGLINKALDSGYKLVIVLAGIHNSLRSQTQLRIDSGVRGRDSKVTRTANSESHIIGVGRNNPHLRVHALTSSEGIGDFDRNSYLSNNTEIGGRDPVIAVIKKNVHVLRNLIEWLKRTAETNASGEKKIRNLPVLIIDDEADNASVNTKRAKEDISQTNRLIRKLLNLFEQNSFLGYTATPFANIFIPNLDPTDLEYDEAGQDLFPRDFIIIIPPPPQYIGALQFFGLDPELGYEDADDLVTLPDEVIIRVDDNEDTFPPRHKKEDPLPAEIEDLPESLLLAVKCFILNCAIRDLRGQGKKHNSMLVHVSYYVRWQRRIKELLHYALDRYQRFIKAETDNFIKELKEIYLRDYIPVTEEVIRNFSRFTEDETGIHNWEDIQARLFVSSQKIRVMEIHGEASEILDYEDHKEEGISVIAVGGNKLSRGLTLEGLSISYFLRSSRAYDTLLQMGRWFGYRPGYLDLCRLFTTAQLLEWFQFITMANSELWSDLKYLHQTGARPEDFGLKVRRHSSGLQITARNKQTETEQVEISFSNRLRETHRLFTNFESVRNNLLAFQQLIQTLPEEKKVELFPPDRIQGTPSNHIGWKGISPTQIYQFLNEFRSPAEMGFSGTELADYISKLNRKNELTEWTIVLINALNAQQIFDIDGTGLKVGKVLRRHDKNSASGSIYCIRKAHIISKDHEWLDLSKEEYANALVATQRAWEDGTRKKKKPQYPSGYFIRKARLAGRGLLLLYVLDSEGYPKEIENVLPPEYPVIGYAVSFPESRETELAVYRVRNDFLGTLTSIDDEDD